MPIRFAFDPDCALVRATFVGSVSFHELTQYASDLASERLLKFAQLIDGRTASLALTSRETREFARLMGSLRAVHGSAPVAFVPADASAYQVAREYWEVGAGANPAYQVFEDLAAAEMWLLIRGR